MNMKLLIENGGQLYTPLIENGVVWSTERVGVPGQLTFNVVPDGIINFTEGNHVKLTVDGNNLFHGFVFTKKRDKNGIISVTAYDQFRYLKNKDTFKYENKTATELIKMIANDFQLQVGILEDTGHKIASKVEDNVALIDIIHNALDLTLQNRGEMYVFYDDFGKLTLKNLASMAVEVVIDEETGENFSYTSSIDSNTYNKIKIMDENEEMEKRDVNISDDQVNIGKWGILQYLGTIQKGENGKAKADVLLELYNKKTRNLSVQNVFGDTRVRAGSLVIVRLNLGDMITSNYMLVERCKHKFNVDEHLMDLNLRGGEFIA